MKKIQGIKARIKETKIAAPPIRGMTVKCTFLAFGKSTRLYLSANLETTGVITSEIKKEHKKNPMIVFIIIIYLMQVINAEPMRRISKK